MVDGDTPIFELRSVTHQFGSLTALENVNTQIHAGERVALVGPSGAGKSTFISLLNGTLHPTEGQVWALGQNLATLSAGELQRVQQQIGTIYQRFHLVDSLKVIHNVNAGHLGRWSFWKSVASLIWPLEVNRAAETLTAVGIPEKLYVRTSQLSGGQQQRVAIARVLVQQPQAILADEPVASLDPERSREIMELLRDISRSGMASTNGQHVDDVNRSQTLVTSLHDIDLARSYCARLIGLRFGSLFFDCPASTVTPRMIKELYQIVP